MTNTTNAPTLESAMNWDDQFLRALGYFLVQANYLEDALLDLYWITTRKERAVAVADVRGKTLGDMIELVEKTYLPRFLKGH